MFKESRTIHPSGLDNIDFHDSDLYTPWTQEEKDQVAVILLNKGFVYKQTRHVLDGDEVTVNLAGKDYRIFIDFRHIGNPVSVRKADCIDEIPRARYNEYCPYCRNNVISYRKRIAGDRTKDCSSFNQVITPLSRKEMGLEGIKEIHRYRDGGTIGIIYKDGEEHYIDHRLDTKTRYKFYSKYPGDNDPSMQGPATISEERWFQLLEEIDNYYYDKLESLRDEYESKIWESAHKPRRLL